MTSNPTTACPVLTTPRLRLRPHDDDDLKALTRLWQDQDVVRFISGKPSTDDECSTRLKNYTQFWSWFGFGFWAVTDRVSERYVGDVGLAHFSRDLGPPLDESPEIGWVLDPEFHGRGLATEAATAVLNWADSTLDHTTIACLLDPEHTASINVARKLNFVDARRTTYKGMQALIMVRQRPPA